MGSMDSFRAAASGTGADFGGEPDWPDAYRTETTEVWNAIEARAMKAEARATAAEARCKVLEEALSGIVGTLDAHEIASIDCDRRGEKYCNCMDRAVSTARAALRDARKGKK